jgi:ATP-dependent Clp protease adapter protein ClpS
VIPGVSLDGGYAFADQIHNAGLAIVWTGQREPPSTTGSSSAHAGLTMAPLEHD